MEQATIVNLLTNSGLKVFGIDSHFVYFQDPACIYPVFDAILDYAWITILVLTGIMLFGWGVLYIKNGVKIDTLFNNAKALILIFCTLGAVKPIVNAVYGDNLFSKQCDTFQVSLSAVNEILEQRNKNFSESDEAILSDNLVIIDSAAQGTNMAWLPNAMASFDSQTVNTNIESSSGFNFFGSNKNVTNLGSTIAGQPIANTVVTFVNRNGETIRHIGGTASWRNNNPGNIIASEFALKHGAVATNGRWAVFPDEETGLKAAASLLKTKSYKDLSIYQAIHRWAPSSDGNNPVRYAQRISQLTGLSINSQIKNLSDTDLMRVTRAIQTIESWSPGITHKL